jgi:acyl-CoA synthetase (AMP-forming)/AMP-acid ligase II
MPDQEPLSIRQLLEAAAPDRPALGAPGRRPSSYGELSELAAHTTRWLNEAGVGRDDRVAIVLPNGPEMAAAFLAVGCACCTAPLNPGYRAREFQFYLADLGASALIAEQGSDSPAVEVARAQGIPVFELRPLSDGRAGQFTLHTGPGSAAPTSRGGYASADDEGLVLHTSGTTSRPKVVPLKHRNLTASAVHVRDTLSLQVDDVGLGIMPLFHIHGLVASVLASVAASAQLVCTPGFNALKMFQWLQAVDPSWYTAVPTMHQAILARARRNPTLVAQLRLRFIRSSSSSLPAAVMQDLEQTFGCPVIESYGMTEAAHQMASNPLPRRPRKPGSVGLPAGPEIAIMNADGALLNQGAEGEVVIRGPNVFSGYQNNPEANASAFAHGWFRTGDQGFFDGDGYLTISGRLKEIINRGGEKIAPREVDEVLQAHPAVEQVVTFAIPHPKLGEEVAAVVVLKEEEHATEQEIRAYAAERLADFKVPRQILFREEIPKGATGKLQRIGLADKLGLGG